MISRSQQTTPSITWMWREFPRSWLKIKCLCSAKHLGIFPIHATVLLGDFPSCSRCSSCFFFDKVLVDQLIDGVPTEDLCRPSFVLRNPGALEATWSRQISMVGIG